ncbi:hypothetical protein N0V85_000732 [Neurospora sp. IMI 360204]|nr:hypothetical protein N0V85_000732 [Neurospora sp. IMI 360204]
MPSASAASNPSDPSDPSNFPTPLSPPPTSPPSLSSPSTTSPILSSITHSLLQTTFSLKRDFRFLKLIVSSSSSISTFNHFVDDDSEGIHNKLFQTSLTRLNSATKSFIRAANVLLDEEVNKSFDAYLRRSSDLKEEEEEEEEEGEGHSVLDMTVEEKETRRELRRLLGVVEELRGVWRRRAGRYLLGRGSGGRGGGKDGEEGSNDREVNGEVHGGKVEDLVVVGRFMIGDGDGNGEGDEGKWGKEREDEEIKVGLERLAERLGMGKKGEGRVHQL